MMAARSPRTTTTNFTQISPPISRPPTSVRPQLPMSHATLPLFSSSFLISWPLGPRLSPWVVVQRSFPSPTSNQPLILLRTGHPVLSPLFHPPTGKLPTPSRNIPRKINRKSLSFQAPTGTVQRLLRPVLSTTPPSSTTTPSRIPPRLRCA